MKKLFQVLAISALVLTGLVASASAQTVAKSTRIKVNFDFNVGNEQLPAGEYRIKVFNEGQTHKMLLVQRLDGKEQAIISSVPNQNRGPVRPGDVTFNKYGDKHFLAGVQLGDGSVNHQVTKSRAERNLLRMSVKVASNEPSQVTVPTIGQ